MEAIVLKSDLREILEKDAAQMREWLAANPEDRRGPKGAIRKSNRTDNESAKMATGKGVIQGYTGVAAVDSAHQIIVEAQAHGTGSEQEVLLPVVTAMQDRHDVLSPHSLITADAGYHSEANLQALATREVDALIADNDMRRRDERFATHAHHQDAPDPLHDKSRPSSEQQATTYPPSDFLYDAEARTCVCPAGKSLYRKGRHLVINGYVGEQFRGAKRDCVPCPHRPVLTHPRENADASSHVLPRARCAESGARQSHGAHERSHRYPRGPCTVWATLRDRGAGLRECVLQQGARSLHPARSHQSRWAVEALLPGPQHREARPSRLRALVKRPPDHSRGVHLGLAPSDGAMERWSTSPNAPLPSHPLRVRFRNGFFYNLNGQVSAASEL